MENNRVRFAVEGDKIFDYETSRYVPIEGTITVKNGLIYSANLLAEAIRNNRFIEEALIGYAERTDPGKEAEMLRGEIEEANTRIAELEGDVSRLQEALDKSESEAAELRERIEQSQRTDQRQDDAQDQRTDGEVIREAIAKDTQGETNQTQEKPPEGEADKASEGEAGKPA